MGLIERNCDGKPLLPGCKNRELGCILQFMVGSNSIIIITTKLFIPSSWLALTPKPKFYNETPLFKVIIKEQTG